MTKEELKKEAVKFAADYPSSYGKGYKHRDLRIAYLAGAKPREKRIAELEKEIAKLKERLENERDLPFIAYMQGSENQKKKDTEQLTKQKELIKELSKSLFLAKGLIRDLCDDTVDFKESKERSLYCYRQKHLDGYKKAEEFLKEGEK